MGQHQIQSRAQRYLGKQLARAPGRGYETKEKWNFQKKKSRRGGFIIECTDPAFTFLPREGYSS
jgi:hypothetical protein